MYDMTLEKSPCIEMLLQHLAVVMDSLSRIALRVETIRRGAAFFPKAHLLLISITLMFGLGVLWVVIL